MKMWFCRIIGVLLLIPIGFSLYAVAKEQEDARTLAPATGRFVSAGDVDLFIQTVGDPSASPILLVHGMGAWSETWRPVITALAAQGWYVIAVDMPPFGFSDRPASGDVWRGAQAGRLGALLDTLKIKEITIVGHSYGSRAVLETAMQYPDLVKGLVLVAPALGEVYASTSSTPSVVSTALVQGMVRYPVIAMTATNPLLSRKMLSLFFYDPKDATDEVLAVYARPSTLRHTTRDVGAWFRGFLTNADQGLSTKPNNYKKLPPTALIWGTEDTVTPLAQGEALHAMIPGSSITVLPGVGHIPHLEDTPAFLNALTQSLRAIR